MITTQNWQKIKAELKKNIEPIFLKAGINLSIPFDQIIDIFQGVLEKSDIQETLDGRDDIETLLSMVYVDGNIKLAGSSLDVLSGKLEGYLKKVFKIANQGLFQQGDRMLAHHLKTVFRVFKANNDPAFLNFTESFITEFFDNTKANYNNPEFFVSAHKIGNHFKKFYTIRNEEGHLYRDSSIVDTLTSLESVIVIYLYITDIYSDRLKQKIIHQPDHKITSNWNIFKQYCGNFSKKQTYFLVIDRLNLPYEQFALLANIKWDFIFDLDINSDSNGVFHAFHELAKFPQVINQIIHTSDDRGKVTSTFPDNTTFWYYVQGTKSRQKSILATDKISDWRVMYSIYTHDLMREYYSKKYSFILTPIKVVILSKDTDKIKEIIYAIKSMDIHLPPVEFLFANEDNSQLIDLINEISGNEISMPLPSLIEGLKGMEGTMYLSNSNKTLFPCHSSKGRSVEIPESIVISVKQYFQIIHLNILKEQQEMISNKSFYQGRNITWQELDNGYDVNRTITKEIVTKIRSLFEKRVESEIIYLIHYAGSGGSTVARRIAFEFYEDNPVLFLNELISSYSEALLVDKLVQIYQITEIPCLVVIDNSNITKQQIENLERAAAHRLAKTIFLFVESTFNIPQKADNRFYISATLDKNEANRFVDRFSSVYPEKIKDFHYILTDDENLHNPFYFGLIAYEKEYISINKYVEKRIEGLTDKERDLLKLMAFCQYYASGKLREVPHFIISKFLEINEEYIRLKKHTENSKIYDLIIETDDLTWRTIHPLIAENILKQLIGTNDLGILNPFYLKDFSIRIVKSLRDISENRNEQVLELLHNIFILRGVENVNSENEEVDTDYSSNSFREKMFSKLINDLAENINRIEAFETLTKEFPDENPHFWGHFSRLYSIDKNFDKAIESIDCALAIDDEDFIFHHIKGMSYRTELYRLKDKIFGNKVESSKYSSEIHMYFEKASEAFQIAREVAPEKEHGYIAFIQMVIQMIEFEYSISSLKTTSKDYTGFIVSNAWCRNLLTQANEVISDYKNNNQEYENPKIREKQNLLLRFYGEKDKLINAWQSLLDKKEFDQNLIRRQLAYAYLAKNDFDWEKTKGKDIKRIMELCEDNLKSKVENRDLRLWFEVSRRLNVNTNELIKKVQEWEFKSQSLETSYYLMCLFGIQAISGVISGVDNFEKYRKEVSKRSANTLYSKIFCIEWLGRNSENTNPILLNHRQIGEWSRDNSFFKEKPGNLLRLKGVVTKYISRGLGFLEIENCGIQVIYQPSSCNHFSDDAQKGTKVSFYLGFNYDGARAFDVKNE